MENVDAGDDMLAVMRIKKDCRIRVLEISVSNYFFFLSLYILKFLNFFLKVLSFQKRIFSRGFILDTFFLYYIVKLIKLKS